MFPIGKHVAGVMRVAAAAVMMAGVLAACAPTYDRGYGGSRYGGYPQRDGTGTIVDAYEVTVRSDGRGGAVVGAVAGGATGAALGGDTGGSIAGGLIGAVIGGVLGSEIEKSAGSHRGVEYVIDMDYGETITVIQDDSRYYRPGTRVRVYFGDYVTVEPLRRRRRY
ncbi:MAG: glycine zipper 2TM domain-containing protein [bacterium]